jgi:membrane associated rhomboid family serine protease
LIPLHDDNPVRRFPAVTVALIAANVAVFAFELMLPRAGLTLDGLFTRAGLIPYEVANRVDVPPTDLVPWYVTPVTSMFLHGGWLHIGFNMLFLWIFGNNVEDLLGRARYLGFYLVCGLVAGFTQVAINTGSTTPTIGASGAIAGVLGAYLVMFPRARVLTLIPLGFFIRLAELPAILVLGFWFVLQLFSGVASLGAATAHSGGVAFWAHIGGFVMGLVVGLAARTLRPGGGRSVPTRV